MTSNNKQRLAVSTVWAKTLTMGTAFFDDPAAEASAILDAMEATGLMALELEYRLSAPVLGHLLPELKPRGFSVGSLHNFLPLPPGMPREAASGDLFNLASLDKDERSRAVHYTTKTMELASDLETQAVVLHLGGVDQIADRKPLPQAARRGEMTPELSALLEQRAKSAPRHLDAVSFSLERLASRAGSLGLKLGLENRYNAFQLPDFAEMGRLLARFDGAPLGLWYDCGHAFVQAAAGLEPALDWLTAYGHTLVGCHLHDATGAEDHQAPGLGDMDWAELTKALAPAPLKVLEVVGGGDPGPLKQGVAMLQELFAAADIEEEAT